MRVVLESIGGERTQPVSDGAEVEERAVQLRIDGRPRTFRVFHRPGVVPTLSAGIVYGDTLLVELLRFEPVALSAVCSAVAARTRGEHVSLPMQLPTRSTSAQSADNNRSRLTDVEPSNKELQTDEVLPPSSVGPRS